MCFEVSSSDEEIVDIARSVFARWEPLPNARLQGEWEIQRAHGGFSVLPEPVPPPGTTLVPSVLRPEQAVTVVEYAAIWRIIEHCTDILTFHSALLSRDGKAVAIVGPSEAGKSTLSTALWKNGWNFLCDDTTMVAGITAYPAPRRVALREGCRPFLGDSLWEEIKSTSGYQKTQVGCLFHPVQDVSVEREVDLSAVIFLKRNGAPPDTRGPSALNPADAALALLPYTNLVRTLPFPQALAPIGTLMAAVPAWDLPRAPLTEMVESVERLAGISEYASA